MNNPIQDIDTVPDKKSSFETVKVRSHLRKSSLQNPSVSSNHPCKSLFNQYPKFPFVKAKLQAHVNHYSMTKLYKVFKTWHNLSPLTMKIVTNKLHFNRKFNDKPFSDEENNDKDGTSPIEILHHYHYHKEQGLRLKNGKLVKTLIFNKRLQNCFKHWYDISKQRIHKRRITVKVSKKEVKNIGKEIKAINRKNACEELINYAKNIELNNKEASKLFFLKKWYKNSKTIYNINSSVNERRNSQVNVFTKSLCRNHYITRKQLKINRIIMSPILSSSKKNLDISIDIIPHPKNDSIKPFSINNPSDTTLVTNDDYYSFFNEKNIDFSTISLNDKSNVSEDNINIRKLRIRKVYRKKQHYQWKDKRNIFKVNETVNQTSKLKQMKIIVRYIRNDDPKHIITKKKQPIVKLLRTKQIRVEDINIGRDIKCGSLNRLIEIVYMNHMQNAFDKFAYVTIKKYHTVKKMRIRSVLTINSLTKILRFYLLKWHNQMKTRVLARILRIDLYSIIERHFNQWKSKIIYRYGHSKREDAAHRFFLKMKMNKVLFKVENKSKEFCLTKSLQRWRKTTKKNVLLKVKHVKKRNPIPVEFLKERIERIPVMSLRFHLLKWNRHGRLREAFNEKGKKIKQLNPSEYKVYLIFMQKIIVYSNVDMKELNRFYTHWKKHMKVNKRKVTSLKRLFEMLIANNRKSILKVMVMK